MKFLTMTSESQVQIYTSFEVEHTGSLSLSAFGLQSFFAIKRKKKALYSIIQQEEINTVT